jgi:hypothetical protein
MRLLLNQLQKPQQRLINNQGIATATPSLMF